MVLKEKVAAVTGAASGIGRALVLELARRGAEIAISDIDEVGLAVTAEHAGALGATVTEAVVDVSDRKAVFDWAERVASDHGRVNLVVNNAGVALRSTIEDASIEDLEWLMGINFWGVVYGTKAFLPHLIASGEGHIVNISSVFGLIGVPGQGAYNAAKFAVRGYTECLRQELELAGRPVSATSVHPGGIKTNIARNARMSETAGGMSQEEAGEKFENLARTTADDAALAILAGVHNNARRVLIGFDARMIDAMQRLAPSYYQPLVTAMAKWTGAAD